MDLTYRSKERTRRLVKIWGTSGIRRVFAPFGDEYAHFTPKAALKIGLAIGAYVKGGTVVVGKDIRTTALPIELALNAGLVSAGCKVLSIGMVTTPTLAMSMKFLGGECGVMITASHNTPEYIGIKLWNPSGLGFTPEQEKELEDIYRNKKFRKVTWDKIGSITPVPEINSLHVDEIMKRIKLGPGRRPNIIVDPGNGSSCEIAPLLMKKLGCRFVTLNSQPDGFFPGRLSEPNSKNLRILISFLQNTDEMDLGIALDGDADRVIFVDGNGKIIEPIRLLALLARRKLLEDPPKEGEVKYIMTPINSSGVIEHICEPLGGKVIRTQVGDIKVAIEMYKRKGILGGENAGTYIWPNFHYGPDSLVTIAKVVEMLTYTDKTFAEIMNEIPEFPFMRKSFELVDDIPITEEDYERMYELVVDMLKTEGHTDFRKNTLDGIRIDYDRGWILIRRSGTSPIIRISCESTVDMADAERKIDKVADILENDLKIIKRN